MPVTSRADDTEICLYPPPHPSHPHPAPSPPLGYKETGPPRLPTQPSVAFLPTRHLLSPLVASLSLLHLRCRTCRKCEKPTYLHLSLSLTQTSLYLSRTACDVCVRADSTCGLLFSPAVKATPPLASLRRLIFKSRLPACLPACLPATVVCDSRL